MHENITPDSNAVALAMRNFGVLPPELGVRWMRQLPGIKTERVPLPEKVIIEIANTCNLDCPMCRVGRYGVNLSRVLEPDRFIAVLDQLQGIKIVRLNGLGESTLLPGFPVYLDALFQRQISIELITNGTADPAVVFPILERGGVILLSWDAAEAGLFETLRRPARWKPMTEKLQELARMAATAGASERLSLLFTLQNGNIGQLAPLVTCCSKWGIRNILVNVVKLTHMHWADEQADAIQADFNEAASLAAVHGIKLLLPAEINGRSVSAAGTVATSAQHCRMPWEEAVIRWNGDVQVCNMFNPYTYGNLFLNDFRTIWENAFAGLFRKMINTEERHAYCKNCVYMKDAYDYIRT